MRRVVAVLLVAVAVSVVAAPAGAQESDDEPPSEDRSIPDDAFTIVGSPDPGPEPEHPGDRGGWAQFLTLGLIVAGVGVVAWRITHGMRNATTARDPG